MKTQKVEKAVKAENKVYMYANPVIRVFQFSG